MPQLTEITQFIFGQPLSEVADYSSARLPAFLAPAIASGTTAKTDGWSAYPGAADIAHDPHVIGKMLPTQPVIDAQGLDLEVREDPVDPGQHDVSSQ